LNLGAADAGEREQVIYQLTHAPRSSADSQEMPPLGIREFVSGFFFKDLDEAHDVPQRRAEVMGNRVCEGLQLAVCAFEFAGSCCDTLFQCLIEAPHLILGQAMLGDIAQVALNELPPLEVEHVANSFDLNVQPIPVLHAQVLPAKNGVSFDFFKKRSITPEKRPQGCDTFRVRRDQAGSRQPGQKTDTGIHIDDSTSIEVQDKNSVLR
jgi:hypothetical protein